MNGVVVVMMERVPMPPGLVALVACIADRLPSHVAHPLVYQSRVATVVEKVPGRSISVFVPPGATRVPLPDGPLEPIPAVLGGDGELTEELIVWLDGGLIVGLEQPWFGDEPPKRWPAVEAPDFS